MASFYAATALRTHRASHAIGRASSAAPAANHVSDFALRSSCKAGSRLGSLKQVVSSVSRPNT